MGRPVKLAIVDAGSASFSLGLVRDHCLKRSLWGSAVSFIDLDAERLEVIQRLATRYAGELGVDLRFETTLDRRRALDEADFVINTAALPHRSAEKLRAIDERHGYYRGAHFFYYQHQLKLMMDVARDMERQLAAFRGGDRRMLLSQLLWDHRTKSSGQAEALLDEVLGLSEMRGWAERFRDEGQARGV